MSSYTFCTSCGVDGIGPLAQCGCKLSDVTLMLEKDEEPVDFGIEEFVIYRALMSNRLHMALKDSTGLYQSKLSLNCYPVPVTEDATYSYITNVISETM